MEQSGWTYVSDIKLVRPRENPTLTRTKELQATILQYINELDSCMDHEDERGR